MLRKIVIGACSLALAAIIGCSGFDSTMVIDHPEQVKPSSNFTVALVNVFTYLSSDTIIPTAVERDSLHLLVGLPELWNVESATMVVIDDMTVPQLLALQENTFDQAALAPLLLKYANKMVTLPTDPSLAATISGKTIGAHSKNSDEEIMVAADAVKQWKGFSAPVNISIKAGSKPDTMIALDTILDLAGDSSLTDITSNPLMPQKVGVSMVPVVVLLSVKSGSAVGNDTLYYFSKTGSMTTTASPFTTMLDDSASKAELAALENGDMAYIPITVSSSAAIRNSHLNTTHSTISAHSNNRLGTVSFNLGNLSAAKSSSISIYSLQGSLVTTITPQTQRVVWDGRDSRGNRVKTGSYVARIGSTSMSIQLLR